MTPQEIFDQALCHYEGKEGYEKDHRKAYGLFLEAAQAGHVGGQSYLGRMLSLGEGVKQNHEEALKWLHMAAEAGDSDAMHRLGKKYYCGQGTDKDVELGIRLITKAAEAGHLKAMKNISLCYYRGDGVPKDKETAYMWCRKAAEMGYTEAMHNLARMLTEDKEYSEAFEWYKKAADNGAVRSMLAAGRMYLEGKGTKADPTSAYSYFLKAEDAGSKAARHNIASLYAGQSYIDRNIHEYLRNLHRCNDVHSLLKLADVNLRGIGVTENPYEAVRIWRKISSQGYKIANYNLGVAYYLGIGTDQDIAAAKEYLTAVKGMDKDADVLLENIENGKKCTPQFHLDSRNIVKDSILEAESKMVFRNKLQEPIGVFEKNPSAETCFWLARLYQEYDQNGGNNDYVKSEMYFNKALELKHPYATFISNQYRDSGKTFEEYDLYAPYHLTDLIESCFQGKLRSSIWDKTYVLNCVFKGLPDMEKTEEYGTEWEKMLFDKTSHNPIASKRRHCLFAQCVNKERQVFINECLDYLWQVLESGKENTTLFPSKVIYDSMTDMLSSSETICFDEDSSLKFLKFTSPDKKYIYSTQKEEDYIIGNFIAELACLTNVTIRLKTAEEETAGSDHENRGNYDAMVIMPEIGFRRTEEISYRLSDVSQRYAVLKSLKHNEHVRKILILVDKEFCTAYLTKMYRKRLQLLKNNLLEAVIEFPKETFNDVRTSTALLVLNFEAKQNSVRFIRNGKETCVSYDMLKEHKYCLSHEVYAQNPVIQPGQTEVTLSEIAVIRKISDKISKDDNHSEKTTRCLTDSNFQDTLNAAISTRNSYSSVSSDRQAVIRHEYRGPHIFLKYRNGIRINMQTDNQLCFPGYDACAIKLKKDSPVTLEYLAYLLFTEEVRSYISEITDKDGLIVPYELRYKKLAIYKDKNIQNQIVEDTIIKERQLSGSGIEYNVILIGKENQHLNQIIAEKGINIFHRLASANGESVTFESLYEKYIEDPSKAMVDAIILDTSIDDYEDVLYHFKTIRERNIHIYLIGNGTDIHLGASRLKEYFIQGNRFFDIRTDDYSDRVLNKMRDDLDSSNAPQAKIRNRYKAVFEAADALDKKYPDIGISKAVIRYIQTGCNIDDDESISGPCSTFRTVCHKMLGIFISKNLVPAIDPGAIPGLLKDGMYEDSRNKKKQTYVLKILFMPKYLAKALDYFCKVTNEGVHGSQDSSRLGTAALNILMEFIVWFHEKDIVNNELPDVPGNYFWENITGKLEKLKGKTYTVSCRTNGKDRYFYADEIHFNNSTKLADGTEVQVEEICAECVTDNERRQIDGKYILYFASRYRIL